MPLIGLIAIAIVADWILGHPVREVLTQGALEAAREVRADWGRRLGAANTRRRAEWAKTHLGRIGLRLEGLALGTGRLALATGRGAAVGGWRGARKGGRRFLGRWRRRIARAREWARGPEQDSAPDFADEDPYGSRLPCLWGGSRAENPCPNDAEEDELFCAEHLRMAAEDSAGADASAESEAESEPTPADDGTAAPRLCPDPRPEWPDDAGPHTEPASEQERIRRANEERLRKVRENAQASQGQEPAGENPSEGAEMASGGAPRDLDRFASGAAAMEEVGEATNAPQVLAAWDQLAAMAQRVKEQKEADDAAGFGLVSDSEVDEAADRIIAQAAAKHAEFDQLVEAAEGREHERAKQYQDA